MAVWPEVMGCGALSRDTYRVDSDDVNSTTSSCNEIVQMRLPTLILTPAHDIEEDSKNTPLEMQSWKMASPCSSVNSRDLRRLWGVGTEDVSSWRVKMASRPSWKLKQASLGEFSTEADFQRAEVF